MQVTLGRYYKPLLVSSLGIVVVVVVRFIKHGVVPAERYPRCPRSQEVGGVGDSILNSTITIKMILHLKWASLLDIFHISSVAVGRSQDSAYNPRLLKRQESRGGIEPKSFFLLNTSLAPFR